MPDVKQSMIDQIDQCLPQTQCTLCTYPRCREYAEAIATGDAEINQCPPGGKVTISALSTLLSKPALPLNKDHGVTEPKSIAFIVESMCIGCKLCIKACPVDCIVGAPKLMHTVISKECTGCKLCIPVCPTDCIVMNDQDFSLSQNEEPSPWPGYSRPDVEKARKNTERKLQRIMSRDNEKKEQRRITARKQMQREILEAVKRKNSSQSD